MLERRRNPIGRAATAGIPRISLGGLRLGVLGMEETADFMIEMAMRHRRVGRPLYMTSANGEVLARCHRDPETAHLQVQPDQLGHGAQQQRSGRLMGALGQWGGEGAHRRPRTAPVEGSCA